VRNLGSTVDGRDLDVVTVGRDAPGRVPVWIIARQHPGETMAEWFVEGLLERLLDNADPVARKVREHAVLHIVPNMNPDGAVRGNLRTNAAGRNLNREWRAPDPVASPEVFLVRAEMERTGCALFLDIHGDESLPYVFFSTAEEVPGFTAAAAAAQARFVETLLMVSPDFQTQEGYKPGRFGEELLTLASKWVANQFGCVSLTLEMPFKDNGTGFFHLGFDERVAGAAHDRLAFVFLDPRRQIARAFDVENDLGLRVARQHVGGEQHHLPIWIDDVAFFGDHTEAVAVAVESQTDFGIGGGQRVDYVLQVFRLGWIWMVVREGAIHFAEQFAHLAIEAAVQHRRKCAGNAVAAVHHDIQRTLQVQVGDDAVEVFLNDVVFAVTAFAVRQIVVFQTLQQVLNCVASQGFAAQQHFQAVVFGVDCGCR
jgi:hypothetical protein